MYLANSLGFSNLTGKFALPKIKRALENHPAVKVYEPFEQIAELHDKIDSIDKAFNVSITLKDKVKQSDAVFAILNGVPPDDGVSIKVGIATALEKPIFLFRDDIRKLSETDGIFDVNLMFFSSIPQDGEYGSWKHYHYKSLDQIANCSMAYWKWANAMACNCR